MLRQRTTIAGDDAHIGDESHVLEVGKLRVDTDAFVATLGGIEIALAPREFRLLVVLARVPGVTVTYHRLLMDVWGENRHADTGLPKLRSSMNRLRQALSVAGPDPTIATVLHVGYRLLTQGPSPDNQR